MRTISSKKAPLKRVDVVSAIIRDDTDNFLLVKNVDGDSCYWGLPGGAVEDGETLEQAVVREVKEETGFDVVVTGFSSLREKFFLERQHHVLFATFTARVVDGEFSINDPDNDIAEVRWVDAQMAKQLMGEWFQALRLDSNLNKLQAFYAYEGTE